jgi:hypothetical protein
MLYIIKKDYFLADYIVDPLNDRENIIVVKYKRNKYHGIKKIKHLILRFIRTFILNKKGLWTHQFFPETFLQELRAIKKTDKVLFWGCENLKELLILNKEIKCQEKNVFLWNPVSTICRNAYSKWEYGYYLNKTQLNVFTFDEGDATSLKFNKINQVYRFPNTSLLQKQTDFKTDVFFIGKDKHRSEIIAQLIQLLKQQNICFDFYIIKDKHTITNWQIEPYYKNNEISYEDSLEKITQTKCIIEILQKGQTGMTLRTLEAIFLKKKLITTNCDIVKTPIYHPNNIYILDYKSNTYKSIKEFLDCEYYNIPDNVIRNYDVEYWIKQFI